jgi:hypothetical protein
VPIPDSDPKPPTIALPMPPTAWANSLYECSTTQKLTHFYYAFLNFPVVLTLILALNARYLKGFLGLTADRVCQHIDVSIESKCGHPRKAETAAKLVEYQWELVLGEFCQGVSDREL